jgi:catechol 2,3-dioxygenase-like lactoylglutathione lyase family enzyme
MIRKVSAAVLFVDDLEKCMKFYRDALGLEVVFSDEVSYAFKMDGQDFALVHVSAGVDMMNAEVLGQPRQVARRIMLCADVDSADNAYKTLTERGVTFIKPPISQAWGWRTAYFADPEGNLWELREAIPQKA